MQALGSVRRPGLQRFKDVRKEKRVLVLEEDGRTLINEYRLEQTAEGKWQVAPLELSPQQEALLHGERIRDWAKGKGEIPPDRLGSIYENGQMHLCNIDGDNIGLSSLGSSRRPGLQRFKGVGKEKRVLVFEEDGRTLIKEYRLEQTADGKWQAAPLELSSRQEGEMIRDWAKGKGAVPADRLGSIYESGQMYLCNIDGNHIILSSLGPGKRPGLQRFREAGDEKRVEIYEAAGELISVYVLAKGGEIYYRPHILKDEVFRQKVAELEKLVNEGRHRALLENLPSDLRIDFLLMLYSQKFGEEVLLEFSRKIGGASILDSLPQTSGTARTVFSYAEGSELKAKKDGEKLKDFEDSMIKAVFKGMDFEGILSIVQAKYLHLLLSEHKFRLPPALKYAKKRLGEMKEQKSLLALSLKAVVEYLEGEFAIGGLSGLVTLKPHQVLGTRFLLDNPRALLADEMGSGKTLQALLAAVNAKCKKVVIICRPSGRRIWKKEIKKRLSRSADRSFVVVRSGLGLKKAETKRFVIVNYEYARGHVKEIQGLNPDMIILDEAHALCHEDSKQSLKIRGLKAPRKIAMTGTPILNEARELWPILYFLFPEEFPSSEYFVQSYTSNMYQRALLHNRLRGFMLRRKMSEYRINMPPLVEEWIEVPLTEKQREVYREIVVDPIRWAHKQGRRYSRLRLVAWLLQAADDLALLRLGEMGEGGKYAKVEESVKASPEKRRLIFVRYRIPLKHLSNLLPDCRIIMMETPQKERDEIIEEYKAGKIKTIAMTYKIGGESYNLPETDEIILFDQPWNTPQKMQAIYRGYRLDRGKDRELKVISLLSEDTIDVDMVTLQENKWREFREVVEGAKDRRHLNEQNMERLLEMSQRRRWAQTMAEEYMEELPEELRTAEFYQAIGRGDFESIAQYYKDHLEELKSFWSTVARIGMMKEMGAGEWQNELSLGSGPSTTYEAWRQLSSTGIVGHSPKVVDVDQSPAMNEVGANPEKYLMSMTEISGLEREFNVVGAEFSFYYVDPVERAEVIRQAWRKLKEKGYLVLSGPGMVFEEEAIQGIEKLGFKVLTDPAAQIQSSKLLLEFARAFGKTEQEALSLINNTGILIAQKTDREPTAENVYIPISKKVKEEEASESPKKVETRLMDEMGRVFVAYLPENDPRLLRNR